MYYTGSGKLLFHNKLEDVKMYVIARKQSIKKIKHIGLANETTEEMK